MPCSDPEPNNRDLRANNAAELIIILCDKLGKPVPDGVEYHTGYGILNQAKNCDNYTNILCTMIKGLTKEQEDLYIYNGRDAESRKLADWWDEHKLNDALRDGQ